MQSLLDVGCGFTDASIIRFGKVKGSVGVEIYKPFIKISKSKGNHDHYIQMDIRHLGFQDETFNTVICLDVIEHLTRREAYHLIRELIRIAHKKVVIYTPNGFVPQKPSQDNKYQEHKSAWCVEDFTHFGFKVEGKHGLRGLRGEKGVCRFKPRTYFMLLERLCVPFLKLFPRFSFSLYCVLTKEEKEDFAI